jgi:hypothetical protein
VNAGQTLILWYPSFEWHHMSAEPLQKQDATNKGGPSLSVEWWLGNPDTVQPYVIGKGSITRDALNDTTTQSVDVLFPYAGFQYFRNLAITQNENIVAPLFDGGAAVLRAEFEWYPLNKQAAPAGRWHLSHSRPWPGAGDELRFAATLCDWPRDKTLVVSPSLPAASASSVGTSRRKLRRNCGNWSIRHLAVEQLRPF